MRALRGCLMLLVVVFGLPVIYSIIKGYTTVFLLHPGAQITVNHHPVKGSIHGFHGGLVITRRDTVPAHSYYGSVNGTKIHMLDCGSWIAPRFPVFLSNHQSPICASSWTFAADPSKPETPPEDAEIDGQYLRFRTENGDLIEVKR